MFYAHATRRLYGDAHRRRTSLLFFFWFSVLLGFIFFSRAHINWEASTDPLYHTYRSLYIHTNIEVYAHACTRVHILTGLAVPDRSGRLISENLAYGGLWYFAERGKLLPWCRCDNMLDDGGWRDDAPISSPSWSIWISCAVTASDRMNWDTTPFHRQSYCPEEGKSGSWKVRVSRHSNVLERRMKWSQRSSSLQTTHKDAHARPTPSCRTRRRSLIFRLGLSVRIFLQAKGSGIMSAAMNFVTNRISKQNWAVVGRCSLD